MTIIDTEGVTYHWATPNTMALFDKRTNSKAQYLVPYAEEDGFYSKDEMEDIVGHALESFTERCAEKPTHVVPDKAFQHGLGKTLDEIKQSRENRQELGGPKYHQIRS